MAIMISSSNLANDLANVETWQQFHALRVECHLMLSAVAQFPHRQHHPPNPLGPRQQAH